MLDFIKMNIFLPVEDLIRFMVSYKDDYLPTSRGFDTYYGKPMVACTGFTSLLIFGVVV
jgi:hypothetical protein